MKILDRNIAAVGMGCWAIGGPFNAGSESWGYSNTSTAQSERTIHAALDAGVQLFDTAPAYGAGHSERLLGKALQGRPDVVVVTKLGIAIDEHKRQVVGEDVDPASVESAINASLARLQRERIDILLLHLNSLRVEQADAIFDEMDRAVAAGKLAAYGWSTDYPDSVQQTAHRDAFRFVEHGMNILMDVPTIQSVVRQNGLTAFIRSPLGMGVLTGKYSAHSAMPADDIRASGAAWMEYFDDGRPSAAYLSSLEALRELLQSDGRTLAQGALCWLLARNDCNLPVPGARTPEQAIENAGALQFGPWPESVMQEIESLIRREPEGAARDR